MKNFSKDIFDFVEARIVRGNKGTGVGVIGGLREPDGIRMKDTGNLFWFF